MRLNKYISDTGYCSRREADKLIELSKVTVNGKIPKKGTRVDESDRVVVSGQLIQPKRKKYVYIALNKPVGLTSTTEQNVRENIVDFVGHSERIFPIGRLDKDSDGLILLTNDGDIVNRILRAENAHEKEYIVTVNKPITNEFLYGMGNGVRILGQMTRKCQVHKLKKNVFRIVLTEGKNRQIRRMCKALGYEVSRLQRVRIMNIRLRGLKLGQWRNLTKGELEELFSTLSYKLP